MLDILGICNKNIKNKKNVVYVRAYEDKNNVIIKIGRTNRTYKERDKEYPPIIPIFDMAALVDVDTDLSKLEERLRTFANFLCITLGGDKEKMDWFVFPLLDLSVDYQENNTIEQDSAIELAEQVLDDVWDEYNDEYDDEEQVDEITVEIVVAELVKQLDLSKVTKAMNKVAQQVKDVTARLDKMEKGEADYKSKLCGHLYCMFGSFLAGIESVAMVSGNCFNNAQLSFDDFNGNGNGKKY